MIWAIKDGSFGAAFFDAGAASFFTDSLSTSKQSKEMVSKRARYQAGNASSRGEIPGSALGPDWHSDGEIKGLHHERKHIKIEFECQVEAIYLASELPSTKYHKIVEVESTSSNQGKGLIRSI